MANTYVSFTANSTADADLIEYTIPFKFLNAEDIKVRSINTTTEAVLQWIYVPIATWNTNLVNGETSYPFGYYSIVFENGVNKIKFSPVRPLNVISGTGFQEFTITIYRRTLTTNSTYFSNGSPIQASDLNAILLQSLYNSEEALEGVDSVNTIDLASKLNLKVDKTGDTLTGTLNFSNVGELLQVSRLQVKTTGDGVATPRVFLQGGTIQNVPTPTLDSDAVNKAYVDGLTLNGGSAPVIASDSISEALLRKVVGEEAVTTSTIRPLAVTNAKLGSSSVSVDKLASNAVIAVKIATGAVTSAKLGTSAVTSVAINAGAVLEDKIGTGAVTNTKLGANAVTADKILDGTITSAKLANQTLNGSTIILNNSIPSSKLQNSGITYGAGSLDIAQTTINCTTATSINAFNATINANNLYSKQTLTLNESNEVNAGTLTLAAGSVKSDPNVNISTDTLNQFTGTIPQLTFFTTGVNDGHYFYKIQAKNPNLLGKPFAKTLMKWQGRTGTQYGSNFSSDKKPTFFYKQIANIPFNYVVYNENPEISLNGTPTIPLATSGEIIFNNSGGNEKKYLITLSGFATTYRSNATLYIKPIVDSYTFQGTPQYTTPKSLISVIFRSAFNNNIYSYRTFSSTTIFTLPGATTLSFPVQYFYFDSEAGAPPTNIPCGFGYGMEMGIDSFYAPPAWTGNLGGGYPNTWNDSIVDLLIERIQ